MKKVYLAGGISDTARKNYQKELAKKIRDLGYEVYAAAENNSINDKSNNPTPLDIYNGDIERVKECDIFIATISGGNEDGTISEIGMVAGWNEYEYLQKIKLNKQYEPYKPIKIVAFTTNERLMTPQFYKGSKEDITGLASAGYNHLVLGMIDKWGEFVGNKEDMLNKLKEMKE